MNGTGQGEMVFLHITDHIGESRITVAFGIKVFVSGNDLWSIPPEPRHRNPGPSAVEPSLPMTVKDSFSMVLIFICRIDNPIDRCKDKSIGRKEKGRSQCRDVQVSLVHQKTSLDGVFCSSLPESGG